MLRTWLECLLRAVCCPHLRFQKACSPFRVLEGGSAALRGRRGLRNCGLRAEGHQQVASWPEDYNTISLGKTKSPTSRSFSFHVAVFVKTCEQILKLVFTWDQEVLNIPKRSHYVTIWKKRINDVFCSVKLKSRLARDNLFRFPNNTNNVY